MRVPGAKFGGNPTKSKAAAAQQHQQVEQQVGRLADQTLIGFADRGERHLEAFLADLLRDVSRAL